MANWEWCEACDLQVGDVTPFYGEVLSVSDVDMEYGTVDLEFRQGDSIQTRTFLAYASVRFKSQ